MNQNNSVHIDLDSVDEETFPEEPADALVGVQRLIRRRRRREMPAPRLRGAEVELLRLAVARPGIGISDAARTCVWRATRCRRW